MEPDMKSDNSIVAALESASEADLEQVDEEISTLRNKLESLTLVRKLLSIKLNGKTPRQPPKRSSKPKADEEPKTSVNSSTYGRRLLAARFLLSGPSTPMAIARQCDIPSGSITAVLNHEWFTKNGSGEVHLTSLGRKAATEGA